MNDIEKSIELVEEKGMVKVQEKSSITPIIEPVDASDVVEPDWVIDVPEEGNPALENLGVNKNKVILPRVEVQKSK